MHGLTIIFSWKGHPACEDGQAVGQADTQTDRQTDIYTDGQSDRHIDRRTYGQTDRLTDGQTDRQMGKMKSLCLFASLVLSIVCVNHISLKFSSLFQLHNLP